jgi:hypothetical protein
MKILLSLLAAVLSGSFLSAAASAASVSLNPFQNTADLATRSDPNSPDSINPLITPVPLPDTSFQIGRNLDVLLPTPPLKPPQHLSLQAKKVAYSSAFYVGRDVFTPFNSSTPTNFTARPAAHFAAEFAFLHHQVYSRWDAPAWDIDTDEVERPWSDTLIVHFSPPTKDSLIPFAAFAYETDPTDEFQRLGVGAGANFKINDHVILGTEFLYFDSSSNYNETLSREARLMAHLQISF